jgi:hypothetical protein
VSLAALSSRQLLAILCKCAGENVLLRKILLALWCNWLTRRPLKAKSPGSSPGNATKFLFLSSFISPILVIFVPHAASYDVNSRHRVFERYV